MTGLKFIGFKTHKFPDGMAERDRIYEYRGKLWSSGDVLFIRKTDATKANRDKTGIVVAEPRGRGYILLHKVKK